MLLFFLDTNVFVSFPVLCKFKYIVWIQERSVACVLHTDHLGKVTGLESKNRDIKDGVSGWERWTNVNNERTKKRTCLPERQWSPSLLSCISHSEQCTKLHPVCKLLYLITSSFLLYAHSFSRYLCESVHQTKLFSCTCQQHSPRVVMTPPLANVAAPFLYALNHLKPCQNE